MSKTEVNSSAEDSQNFLQGKKNRTAGAYIGYLAALNITNRVFVERDLVDVQGELLLAKDAELSLVAARRIQGKQLPEPIEFYVGLENFLDALSLKRDLCLCVERDAFFFSLFERHQPDELCLSFCNEFARFPILQQKITVMAEQLPDLYQRSLNSCVLIVLLGLEMRLPRGQLQHLFLAALSHDIGMLDIDPQVLNKTAALTVEEWGEIQSHVERATSTLSLIPDFEHDIVVAVGEHHERCDGTGYPIGRVESELTINGQLLALADSVTAIYFNNFKNRAHSWLDTLPVIQLNEAGYFNRSLELLHSLVRRAGLPLQNVVNEDWVPDFVEELLVQNRRMQVWFDHLKNALTSVGFTHGDRRLHGLQNLMLHIATSFKGSMLFNADFQNELELLRESSRPKLSKEVENASLIQHEMDYHLRRLTHMLQLYLTSHEGENSRVIDKLKSSLVHMNEYLSVKKLDL
jgi:HD-GYP domain-containing protein (c-di-GMP phosphodiesterase class II)